MNRKGNDKQYDTNKIWWKTFSTNIVVCMFFVFVMFIIIIIFSVMVYYLILDISINHNEANHVISLNVARSMIVDTARCLVLMYESLIWMFSVISALVKDWFLFYQNISFDKI